MSDEPYADRDRSFAVAERAQELMRDYGPSATPQSYAVWYTYVTGSHPPLQETIKRLISQNGRLTERQAEELFALYLAGARLADAAGEASATILSEMTGVMEVLDLSVGSAAQFGASLQAMSQDLSRAGLDGARLREIVGSLVGATREIVGSNRVLEARMRESRAEIEMLREKLETTRRESLTDALTGLANRKHFEEQLQRAVETAQRGLPACLIVLDIDYFKQFNDRFGHLTGDQVLRLVALVMRETVKDGVLARFGGEEFGIILPSYHREQGFRVAESVRTGIMSRELVKRSTGESLGKVTVSVGMAVHRSGDTTVSLLERADMCMFAAKRAGRNSTRDDASLDTVPNVA